jgi:hypothetical protein
MKAGKYGYIEFIDKRKLKNDSWDDEIEPEIRKPTLRVYIRGKLEHGAKRKRSVHA